MSAAKCEPGWGEGLSSRAVPELRDHPTPPLRVDPPPPGEGKKPRAQYLHNSHTFAFSRLVLPELLQRSSAPFEGVGNAGCSMHPQPRV